MPLDSSIINKKIVIVAVPIIKWTILRGEQWKLGLLEYMVLEQELK